MNDATLNLFDQFAEDQQKELSAAFDNRHVTIAACGDLLKETILHLRSRGWKTHEPIWNAALFLNTVSYDLSIGLIELVYERNPWKRRLTARMLALLLFEIGEDLPTLFGKKFRTASINLGVTEDQLKLVGFETKKISTFWRENRGLLKEIRTMAAAHRDHDAIALHESIDGMDLFGLLGLGIQLGSMMNSLGASTQPIISFSSNIESPECAKSKL